MSAFAEQERKHWNQSTQHSSPDNNSPGSSRSPAPPFRNKTELPALHTYPLESLIASLKRNEAVLKNSRAFKTLPDKGKKLIESNALIREAIKKKTAERDAAKEKVRSRSPSPATLSNRLQESDANSKRPSPLSKDATQSSYHHNINHIDSGLQNMILSTSTLSSSSGGSSSGRQSLSSISSDLRTSSDAPGSAMSTRAELPHPPSHKLFLSPIMSAVSRNRSIDGRDIPLREAMKLREEEERMRQDRANMFRSQRQQHHSSAPPLARHHPYFDYTEDDSDDFDGFSEDEYF